MQRLSRFKLFCYGVTDMPLHFALTPVLIFVPNYYTSEMGISLILLGNMLLLARVMDVFTDPLVGYWSDRTRSRWGRRRPWIVVGMPILTLSFYFLFLPSGKVGAGYLFACIMGLYLALTMILIPYYSWAAELSDDPLHRALIGMKLLAELLEDMETGHPGCIVATAAYQDRLFNQKVRDANRRAVLGWRQRRSNEYSLVLGRAYLFDQGFRGPFPDRR